MIESPIITIIVAVYQAEKYIRRCLDSILAQFFTDYEVVLVDDGSVDGGGIICDEYSKRDCRFRVIHKKNEGVSIARQTGLNAAKGEYVIHADPDDWVEPDWLLKLYNKIEEENADMVICDFEQIYANKKVAYIQRPTSLENNDILCDLLNRKLMGNCWNTLIKRNCFDRYHISFPPKLSYGEDLYVTTMLVANNIKVAFLSEILYHYDSYTNENSIVRHHSHNKVVSIKFFIDSLTPILSSKLFDDGWYHMKSRFKEKSFIVNDREFNIRQIYSEINERYIHDHKKDISLKGLVALSLMGYSSIAYFIFGLFKIVIKLKLFLYGKIKPNY